MKVKVLKNFIDKKTGKFKMEGIEYDCCIERAEELKKLGYIKILEPIVKEKENKTEEVKKTTKRKNKKIVD